MLSHLRSRAGAVRPLTGGGRSSSHEPSPGREFAGSRLYRAVATSPNAGLLRGKAPACANLVPSEGCQPALEPQKGRDALRSREYPPFSGGRHDLEKLRGVDELSELRDLAVAHVENMHGWEIQLLTSFLSRTCVADDRRHRIP